LPLWATTPAPPFSVICPFHSLFFLTQTPLPPRGITRSAWPSLRFPLFFVYNHSPTCHGSPTGGSKSRFPPTPPPLLFLFFPHPPALPEFENTRLLSVRAFFPSPFSLSQYPPTPSPYRARELLLIRVFNAVRYVIPPRPPPSLYIRPVPLFSIFFLSVLVQRTPCLILFPSPASLAGPPPPVLAFFLPFFLGSSCTFRPAFNMDFFSNPQPVYRFFSPPFCLRILQS